MAERGVGPRIGRGPDAEKALRLRRKRCKRSRAHLLECLGQFAPDRRRPIPQHLRHRGQRLGQPPRRLEEDQRRRHCRQLRQPRLLLSVLHRQEAGKQKCIGRQARRRQRGEHRRRTRYRHHPDSCGNRLHDQPETRIGDKRRPGVRHQRDAPSLLQRRDQLRPCLAGIVLVIGDRPLPYAVAVEQHARHPGVLAGEQISRGKRLKRTQRDVAQVSNWRRHQVERSFQRPRRDLGLSHDIGFPGLRHASEPVPALSLPRATGIGNAVGRQSAIASPQSGTKPAISGLIGAG